MNDIHCNNCGKAGHLYHQCKMPITSIGIIAFRMVEGQPQYLMICRKDTLGHIDFMRGKYSIYNRHYILNMLNQMTVAEKERLKTGDFDILWRAIWGGNSISGQYKSEEATSREKYNALFHGVELRSPSKSLYRHQNPWMAGDPYTSSNEALNTFSYAAVDAAEPSNTITTPNQASWSSSRFTIHDPVEKSDPPGPPWPKSEWGFPKGRRNPQEKDFECAGREFSEETGYDLELLHHIQNVIPYEEIFTGSNYKSYKHKYYLMYMDYKDTLQTGNFERTEVSKMEWKTYEECLAVIRDYNVEKKRLLTRIHQAVTTYKLYML